MIISDILYFVVFEGHFLPYLVGWAVGGEGMFPSDGFIFHPILNDRQDQTHCSGPVRASDRAEPYVCCREEGAGPSLNVRHPARVGNASSFGTKMHRDLSFITV